MSTILENARKQRAAIVLSTASLDDKTASTVPELMARLNGNGELVKAGTRINWEGTVMKAAVDLWDTAENTPAAAPALWESLPYKDGYRIIPDVITVTGAFSKGECGWWGEVLYRSKVNANTYTPDQYPGNWEIAEV